MKRILVRAVAGLLVPVAGAVAEGPAAADLSWQTAERSVTLLSGSSPVWAYHWDTGATKPYFHPIALPGVRPMTWMRPPDHPWHCGLWFSWKFINGLNYWEEDKTTGRPAGLTLWSNVVAETRAEFSARIAMDLSYAPDGAPAVLAERRIMDISAPAPDGSYTMAWNSVFTAGQDPVVLAATPVNGARTSGGYGGLIWRVAPELSEWQAVNDAGLRDLAAHGEPARALDFSGLIDGRPAGIAIFDDPENPGHPTPWFLRFDPKKPYGLHGPGILFGGPRRLEAGGTMTLRYRIVVHPGRWGAQDLAAKWAEFAR
jgi:hypothetical protein